jgi:hypothetical protein
MTTKRSFWTAAIISLLIVAGASFVACKQEQPPVRERTIVGVEGQAENAEAGAEEQEQGNQTEDGQAIDGESFTFSWAAGDAQVYEYEVYVGTTRDSLELLDSYRHDPINQTFDIANPSVTIANADLEWQPGDNLCFQIVAINVQGPSEPSEVSCLE